MSAGLGNTGIDHPGRGWETRRLRHQRRRRVWHVTRSKRFAGCGRWQDAFSLARGVEVRVRDGVAHASGTQRCKSIWACPVCSAQIRQERAAQIDQAVRAHRAQGGGVLFLTLTTRHYGCDALEDTLSGVMDSWTNGVVFGRGWAEDKARFGVVGFVRSVEITHGRHGWHPHVHALLFLERDLSDFERAVFEDGIFGRWARRIERNTGRRPESGPGVRLLALQDDGKALAEYVGKVQDEGGQLRSVSLEMARHDLKEARRKGATPFQLLDAASAGEADALKLWWEYEAVTKGRRAITWSRGLRERLGVRVVTDEEIVDETVGGELVATFSFREWAELQRDGVAATILEVAEIAGARGVQLVLDLYAQEPRSRGAPKVA